MRTMINIEPMEPSGTEGPRATTLLPPPHPKIEEKLDLSKDFILLFAFLPPPFSGPYTRLCLSHRLRAVGIWG